MIITTNYKTDGIYLPADDRRHFVAWSDRTKEDECFQRGYWDKLWDYYETGGIWHVAAFLMERDISGFNAKAPPPKTEAFWAIVDANRAPEEAELADALDELGNPEAVTIGMILSVAMGDVGDWLRDRRNRRTIPHRLDKCGMAPVRNPDANDGLWRIGGKRQTVYAKKSLPKRNQILAARSVEAVEGVKSAIRESRAGAAVWDDDGPPF